MGRRSLLVAVFLLAALGGFGSVARPAAAVIGGSTVQIQSAPWTVFVMQRAGSTNFLCTGSILDSLHVLTAAHCVFDGNGNVTTPTALSIRAGISNYVTPLATDAEQDRGVSSFRVHPDYTWSEGSVPDDVAVLALTAPLDLSGPAVQAVQLPTAGTAFPTGQQLGFSGFGRENTVSNPDGTLNSFTPAASDQGTCGARLTPVVDFDSAIALCAGAATSSACNGDSGGALVTTSTPPVVVGIASAAQSTCDAASQAVYTYVGAPEILSFIQGNPAPPLAPRITNSTFVRLTWSPLLAVGGTLTCSSGDWQNPPTSTAYAFVDTRTNTVLQQSSKPTYLLTAQNVGARIACRALATNDGGTAVGQTTSTGAVAAAPKLRVAAVRGVVLTPGKAAVVRVVLEPPAGLDGLYRACVTPPASVAPRACREVRVTDNGAGGYPLDVMLHVRSTAKPGSARLAIAASAGPTRASATAVARVVRR
jgi:Trypsin